jgi:hypothetical protein
MCAFAQVVPCAVSSDTPEAQVGTALIARAMILLQYLDSFLQMWAPTINLHSPLAPSEVVSGLKMVVRSRPLFSWSKGGAAGAIFYGSVQNKGFHVWHTSSTSVGFLRVAIFAGVVGFKGTMEPVPTGTRVQIAVVPRPNLIFVAAATFCFAIISPQTFWTDGSWLLMVGALAYAAFEISRFRSVLRGLGIESL